MRNAVCFLTVRPNKSYFDLIEIFTKKNYDIFVVIDDNNHKLNFSYSKEIKIIKYPNNVPENKGFIHTVMYFKDRSCSRDKALYYFTRNENINKYMKIWFVEEDVFIPNFKTIKKIDRKYNKDHDLLCQGFKEFNSIKDWNLYNIVRKDTAGKVTRPYFKSMICAIRVNQKILQVIKKFARKFHTLFLDEALFTTLAMKNNLNIKVIPELSTIVYRREWKLSDIKENNLYHPVKNINRQKHWRKFFV